MHYTLCDLIADIVQNSVEAKATLIEVDFSETETEIVVYIKDNGKGMSQETLNKVSNPFYTDGKKHPNRKIGMGIPFLIQTATETDGKWNIQSVEGKGTTVYTLFNLTNIDTPPLGNVSSLFRQILTFSGDFEMIINRKKNTAETQLDYVVTKSELVDALGSLESIQSLSLLGEYLQSQETN